MLFGLIAIPRGNPKQQEHAGDGRCGADQEKIGPAEPKGLDNIASDNAGETARNGKETGKQRKLRGREFLVGLGRNERHERSRSQADAQIFKTHRQAQRINIVADLIQKHEAEYGCELHKAKYPQGAINANFDHHHTA